MLTDRLRIGFIIDQNPISYWKYDIIEKISQLDFCELCEINLINNFNKEKNLKKSFFQSLLLNYEQRKIIENHPYFKNEIIIDNVVNSHSILNNHQYTKLFLKMIQKSIKLKFYNKFYFDQWILMFNSKLINLTIIKIG